MYMRVQKTGRKENQKDEILGAVERLNEGNDTRYERGHKANCFSSSKTVMELLILVMDKYLVTDISCPESVAFNVKRKSSTSQWLL